MRVPEHRELLGPVLESGKVVLCEWPLARDLAEAEFLRDSGRPGPRFTGLQGHVSPTILWLRDLIGDTIPFAHALDMQGVLLREEMAPLEQPAVYDRFPELAGTMAHNVAHLYAQIVEALAGQDSEAPTFEDGVELHRSLESIARRAEVS